MYIGVIELKSKIAASCIKLATANCSKPDSDKLEHFQLAFAGIITGAGKCTNHDLLYKEI